MILIKLFFFRMDQTQNANDSIVASLLQSSSVSEDDKNSLEDRIKLVDFFLNVMKSRIYFLRSKTGKYFSGKYFLGKSNQL